MIGANPVAILYKEKEIEIKKIHIERDKDILF